MVYFIHGYGATADAYWKLMTVPDTANKVMNAGHGAGDDPRAIPTPTRFTTAACTRTRRPPATGRPTSRDDLVEYIDSHYRTIADRDSRGLAGHSMGGYGTLRIAMKYPGIFTRPSTR